MTISAVDWMLLLLKGGLPLELVAVGVRATPLVMPRPERPGRHAGGPRLVG